MIVQVVARIDDNQRANAENKKTEQKRQRVETQTEVDVHAGNPGHRPTHRPALHDDAGMGEHDPERTQNDENECNHRRGAAKRTRRPRTEG